MKQRLLSKDLLHKFKIEVSRQDSLSKQKSLGRVSFENRCLQAGLRVKPYQYKLEVSGWGFLSNLSKQKSLGSSASSQNRGPQVGSSFKLRGRRRGHWVEQASRRARGHAQGIFTTQFPVPQPFYAPCTFLQLHRYATHRANMQKVDTSVFFSEVDSYMVLEECEYIENT